MKRELSVCIGAVLGLSALAAPAAAQLTYAPVWSADSGQGASAFGSSVASAGDVNGDGYGDVIVGAPNYSAGETWEGRTFVYHGSPAGMSATPSWTAESGIAFAWFGTCVASAGDVNADGYDDVLVGGSQYSNGQNFEGRAWLYLGSASGLAGTPAWSVESNLAFARYGESLAGAGDLNGDGYDDVLVGAYQAGGGGRVYVYHGSAAGLPLVATTTRESPQAGAGFGRSVAGAGDVNGDGYADAIIGAHTFNGGLVNEGAAFLYLGSATGLAAAPVWSDEGDGLNALFGFAVSGAGDVNADGFDDVIVGAQFFSEELSNEGRVFAYYGSPAGLSTEPEWFARPDQVNAHFGSAVSRAGDVNGDGYDDVIVGSDYYWESPASFTRGRAFVFLGGAAGLQELPSWYGDAHGSKPFLGGSVGGGFDANGDGYDDVIGGGQNTDNGTQFAVAFLGGASGSVAPYGPQKGVPLQYAPRLRSLAPPKLGAVATLDFAGGTPFAGTVFLFAGFQPAALPFDGGTLLLVPYLTVFLPPLGAAGTFTLPVALPAHPELQDLDVWLQAGCVDANAPGSHHTVLSNGLRWRLGE